MYVATTAPVVALYQKRISGPLLDCIDIHVDVPVEAIQSAAVNSLPSSSEPCVASYLGSEHSRYHIGHT